MYFHVVDTNFSSDDIDEVINYCISSEYHDMNDDEFEEWVDDNYDGVSIAGYSYSAYEILDKFNNLDAVESEYCEYATNNDRENAEYELRHANPGETIYIQGYSVICEDEEEPGEDTDGDEAMDAIQVLRMEIQKQKEENEKEARYSDETFANYLDLFQKLGH